MQYALQIAREAPMDFTQVRHQLKTNCNTTVQIHIIADGYGHNQENHV